MSGVSYIGQFPSCRFLLYYNVLLVKHSKNNMPPKEYRKNAFRYQDPRLTFHHKKTYLYGPDN